MHSKATARPEADATTMPYFPIFVRLQGRTVLLLGGTAAAASKARLLLKAGAEIRLVTPAAEAEMRELIDAGRLTWRPRAFQPDDLDGAVFAIDGSEDPEQAEALRAAAADRNVLVNVVDVPEVCDFTVPAMLDRSPIVVAVSSAGHAPALSRNIRQRLETAVPEGYGRLAAAAATCRDAVKDALPPGQPRQRFWDEVLNSDALIHLDRTAIERHITDHLADRTVPEKPSVTLVGAGPGDPGLLTLHAAEAIRRADVLLHDALVGRGVLEMARREARLIDVGKRAGRHAMAQPEITNLMVNFARAGQRVVRLKGGDPFIFGRGGEETADLERRGIATRVIPGVTAALACAAEAGIPLTHRRVARSITFATATSRSEAETAALDWRGLARKDGTLVLYMAGHRLAEIAAGLRYAGLADDTPAAVISDASRPTGRHWHGDLRTLPQAAHTPSRATLVIVGHAAALAPARSRNSAAVSPSANNKAAPAAPPSVPARPLSIPHLG